MLEKVRTRLIDWITHEPPPSEVPPCDYTRLKQEIRPGDVLLIEGRSRVSNMIRSITQSPWTHAALYIGRADDIENEEIRRLVEKLQPTDDSKRYIVEGLLGKGMIITPLSQYRYHHIRICRPIGLSTADSELVVAHTVNSVGQPYNMRQLLDLARFILPWSILPRRWGSSLFTTPSGEPESGICSSLIAEAFTAVKFPILPFMMINKESELTFIPRNPYIFTPKDFDYSPYFEIIKYPILNPGEQLPYYRRMPWSEEQIMHQGHGVLVHPKDKTKKPKKLIKKILTRIRRNKVDNTKE
jgi:hypothetical protein